MLLINYLNIFLYSELIIMPGDNEESIKALQIAIEIEKNGYETYTRFAAETEIDAGKRVFGTLAKDEVEHRRILEEQLQRLTEGQPWEDIHIPLSVIEEVAPKIRERTAETKGESALGELDALNTALDLEKKAMVFFKEQAGKTELASAKALFLRLAEWEEAHYDLIKAEIDNINHTGFYLDMWEFKMDGQY